MSGVSATSGNLFIVKVDATSAGKQKAILPGYRPEIVKARQINADGDQYIGIDGETGTGAIKIDQAGAVTFPAANTHGFAFRKDGVEFPGNAAAPLGVAGTWLVEFIRDGYLGMPTGDMSETDSYRNDGIPAEGVVDFSLRDNYETEIPWLFRVA